MIKTYLGFTNIFFQINIKIFHIIKVENLKIETYYLKHMHGQHTDLP